MKMRFAVPLLGILVASCDAIGEQPIPPETLNRRRDAYRQACAAQSLVTRSADDIATIEQVLATLDPSDPLSTLNRAASSAALEYARAFAAHANLRASAYAYQDSAVNHATAAADSARYLERAAAITIRPPQSGTVEENVIASYDQDMVAILENADHPCNWDLPAELQ